MELNFALHVSAVASLHYSVVGEARRPATLYSPITIIKVPLGFTEVCTAERESGGKEQEEWAS